MQLTHYISPKEILIPVKGTNKEAVYNELVVYIASHNDLKDTKQLSKAIFEREESTTTFLPMGVAIPHARIPDIEDIIMVIGVSKNPIEDSSEGSLPLSANVFCLFFSPTHEKKFGMHLKLMSRIAAVFSDTDLVEDLSKLETPEAVFTRIQKREREIFQEEQAL